ncbi:methyltransferase domain-containing protein [Thioclava sp. FR2]|uniref:methyltransferase domain-containing protein n=1 Tax=Thioclava sp. FR2 TaxID=3445780 RepID=UPI003EB9BB24
MSPAKDRNDWNPEAYARFRGLRLRPALDLLAQIPAIPDGDVVDLGCGNGSVGLSLKQRFGDRISGIDSSPAMLEEAGHTGAYCNLVEADIAQWQPTSPPALIYSNAALHWLESHETLMPKLAQMLMPGGVLAVQMPRQFGAPSHRFLRDIAQSMFPDRFDYTGWQAPVAPATTYWQMLAPLGQVDTWEIDYVQHLEPSSVGHPVRRFTESTAMRPFVEKLSETEAGDFIHRYEAALGSAYPLLPDGGVLFPIRRLFFTLKV